MIRGAPRPPRVAVVHDWLIGMRGGERCLEAILGLLPGAPVHTLFHEPGTVSAAIERHPILASPFSRSRFARHHHRWLLPLFPWAMGRFDTRGADRVLSLSHCAAKAAPKGDRARHICYCFTPARYLWDLAEEYLAPGRAGLIERLGGLAWFDELRSWDRASAAGVDRFIAISHHVAERIRRCYGRESEVIHPPVDVDRFCIAPPREVGETYLIVSALVEYKGVDIAVRAFARDRSRRLRIIGAGPMRARWEALGAGAQNIEWLGRLEDAEVARELARCRALLLPCDEDFGIVPLEAMASGRPVVALGRGGALETVVPAGSGRPATGVFFAESDEASLIAALDRLERDLDSFEPAALRERARDFDRPVFLARIAELLAEEGFPVASAPRDERPDASSSRGDRAGEPARPDRPRGAAVSASSRRTPALARGRRPQ